MTRSPRGAALLAGASSGLLAAACFPPLDAGVLAWVAWAPWLFFLARAPRLRDAALAGAAQVIVLHAAQSWWMVHVMREHGGIAWPTAIGMYAFGLVTVAPYGIVTALATAAIARRRGAPALLAAPFVSALVDVARCRMTLGHPWLIPGMTQAEHPVAMGPADVAGVHGLGAVILLVNAGIAAIALVLLRRERPRRAGIVAAIAALVLAVSLIHGAAAARRHAPAPTWTWTHEVGAAGAPRPEWPAQGLRAAIVQGAQPQQVKVRSSDEDDLALARVQLELNRLALDQGAQLVVWAESAHPDTTLRMPGLVASVQDQAGQAQRHVVDPEVVLGALVEERVHGQPPGQWPVTNSALLVDAGGRAGRYDKRRLVPFGEYLPWRPFFGWFPQIVSLVGEMRPGISDDALRGRHGSYGVAVCYEVVLPQRLRDVTRTGADVLLNLTNDGWYHGTWMPEQHLRFAVLRAVETRRYVLRAANSGISAVIAPDGTILGRMEEGRRGVMLATIERRSPRTGWLLWGDAPIVALGLLAAAWAVAEAIAGRRRGVPAITSAP